MCLQPPAETNALPDLPTAWTVGSERAEPFASWGRHHSPVRGSTFYSVQISFTEPSGRSQRLTFTLFILSRICDIQMFDVEPPDWEKHHNNFYFVFLLLKELQPAVCSWHCLISSSHCQTTSVSPLSPPSQIFCSVTRVAD